jgi:hypothetical protein
LHGNAPSPLIDTVQRSVASGTCGHQTHVFGQKAVPGGHVFDGKAEVTQTFYAHDDFLCRR